MTTMLEQAQRGVGMVGRASHLFLPGWSASAVSRTVGWFPESAKGTGPYKEVQPPIHAPTPSGIHKQKPRDFSSWAAETLLPYPEPSLLSDSHFAPPAFSPSFRLLQRKAFFPHPLLLPEVSRHCCLSFAFY